MMIIAYPILAAALLSCTPPTILRQPEPVEMCEGAVAVLRVTTDAPSVTWRRDGIPVGDGPILETTEPGTYIAVARNDCGTTASEPARVTEWPTGSGDVNGDGVVNGLDIGPFVACLLGGGSVGQQCTADLNGRDDVDAADVAAFVGRLIE